MKLRIDLSSTPLGVGRTAEVHAIDDERVDATSTLDVTFEDPENAHDLAQMLGDLHASILNTSVGGLPSIKDRLAEQIDHTDLPPTQRTAAKDALVGLPDGTQTLHNDFHPGNVLITSDGPCTIDWSIAVSGPAAPDVCGTMLLMTPAAANMTSCSPRSTNRRADPQTFPELCRL